MEVQAAASVAKRRHYTGRIGCNSAIEGPRTAVVPRRLDTRRLEMVQMTFDNMVGLIFGIVIVIGCSFAVGNLDRFAAFQTRFFTRVYGAEFGKRVTKPLVSAAVYLGLACGLFFVVLSLIGGFGYE